ncbi:hypothetical protein [Effusibacillus consociatus]
MKIKSLMIGGLILTPMLIVVISQANEPKHYSDTAKTFTYNGVTVHANALTDEVKKAVDEKIKAAKEDGKPIENLEIVASNAKPGLIKYAKQRIKDGKMTKEEAKKQWGLTDDQLK